MGSKSGCGGCKNGGGVTRRGGGGQLLHQAVSCSTRRRVTACEEPMTTGQGGGSSSETGEGTTVALGSSLRASLTLGVALAECSVEAAAGAARLAAVAAASSDEIGLPLEQLGRIHGRLGGGGATGVGGGVGFFG